MAVQVTIDEKTLAAHAGLSLFDCAEQIGVRVPTSCRKNGKCRECLVEIGQGMECLTARAPEEDHLTGAYRLSCRARLAAEDGTIICHTLRRGSLQISDSGDVEQAEVSLEPAVKRDGDTILIEEQPVASADGPILGAALDVGTTTVVVRVVDLETGRAVAGASFENPQRFGGSDIMARIAYDSEHPGKLLQRTLLAYLGHCLEDLPVPSKNIYETIVAGNPTMRDLFFGLNVETIGQKPYWSITEYEFREGKRGGTGLCASGKKLQLPIHPQARVVGLPLIGSHVGADTAAGLLATGIHRQERLVAMMDIGTNTELLCGRRGKIMAASCPAGPAFEGGAISCGMPALDGAIERVRLRGGGQIEFQTIGGATPQGICGSGLVDALSEFRRYELMDTLGRYRNDANRYAVDSARGIFLSENDISELAQAKGANMAGLRVLLNRYGASVQEIDVFYLAGGFARHLDIEAAKRIGLIPNLPSERFRKIGNAAIEGASMALCSLPRRRELEELVKTITHVSLETDPHFFDHFVDGCQFDYIA